MNLQSPKYDGAYIRFNSLHRSLEKDTGNIKSLYQRKIPLMERYARFCAVDSREALEALGQAKTIHDVYEDRVAAMCERARVAVIKADEMAYAQLEAVSDYVEHRINTLLSLQQQAVKLV